MMVRLVLAVIVLGSLAAGCAGPAPEPASPDSPTTVEASSVDNLFTLGQQAAQAKEQEEWATARAIYSRALEIAPGHPVVYERLAEVEIRLGDLDAALGRLATLGRLGGTSPRIDQEIFAPLASYPGFSEVAEILRANAAPQPLAEIFVRFDDYRLSPEGLAWDSRTGDLFTGSFLRRKIVRITPEGEVSDLGESAEHGLGAVLGMWVDAPRRELWAAAGSDSMETMTYPAELVRYNVDSGELVARYPVPVGERPLLVNDVVVTPDGTAWMTESLAGRLYRVRPGADELELFVEFPQFGFANGIAASADGRIIYVAHAEGLSGIDSESGAIRTVEPRGEFTLVGADGLNLFDGGLVLVQNQPSLNNRVVRVELDPTGYAATGLRQLNIGLPPGLDPYTCAVAGEVVFVTVSPPIGREEEQENVPAPGIARIPL